MKALSIITILLSLILSSCVTTATSHRSVLTRSDIDYQNIDSKEYKLSDFCRQIMPSSSDFFYDPNIKSCFQREAKNYISLQTQSFKVMKTGIVTNENIDSKTSQFRYSDVEIDGNLYKIDKSFSTMIITEDGTIYYYSFSSLTSLKFDIVLKDGNKISNSDIFNILGEQSFQKLTLKANVKFDRFEKLYQISTPIHQNSLIRGAIKSDNQSIIYIQLYLDLVFLDDWGHISRAIDLDGNSHEVTKISSNTEFIYGNKMKLIESVGVELDREFLTKHIDGFELKLAGKQDKIVKIPGQMVKSFLEGLDSAILKSESNLDSGM